MIPLSVPHISGNEWTYIKDCLDRGWVSSVGKYVDKFEADICRYTGAKHAVACVNGTAALRVSLQLAGISANDEVLVPTLAFIAPVNALAYLGAVPVFMDCDHYYNMDVEKTVEFIEKETRFQNGYTLNKTSGRTIKALIPVHVLGNAVDLKALMYLCEERNITIIEDAAESIGTFYTSEELKNKYTGTVGRLGCYSFNGNKIITTGGGGMIVTDDDFLAGKARYLTTQAKDDPVHYIHDEVGYNFRMSNLQAAMGVAQLEKLADYIEVKKKNYRIYKAHIDQIPGLHLAELPGYADNNHWMYALQIEKSLYPKNREKLMAFLMSKGIQTRPIWQLNHLQKPYSECQTYKIEKASTLLEKTLNIPCSVNLTEDEQNKVIRMIKQDINPDEDSSTK